MLVLSRYKDQSIYIGTILSLRSSTSEGIASALESKRRRPFPFIAKRFTKRFSAKTPRRTPSSFALSTEPRLVEPRRCAKRPPPILKSVCSVERKRPNGERGLDEK